MFVDNNNSDVIELSGSRFLALRVSERLPEGYKSVDEVEDDILATLERKSREG